MTEREREEMEREAMDEARRSSQMLGGVLIALLVIGASLGVWMYLGLMASR
jgi:hypothetical protein